MCCRRGLLCLSCGQQGLGGVSFSNREPVSSLNNTTQQPTVRSLALTAAEPPCKETKKCHGSGTCGAHAQVERVGFLRALGVSYNVGS